MSVKIDKLENENHSMNEKISLLEEKCEALERKVKKYSKMEGKLKAIEIRMAEVEE